MATKTKRSRTSKRQYVVYTSGDESYEYASAAEASAQAVRLSALLREPARIETFERGFVVETISVKATII